MPDSMLHMQVSSDYTYQDLEGMVLNYRMTFLDSEPIRAELQNAADKMEAVAKGIASSFRRTGNLEDNIRADVVAKGLAPESRGLAIQLSSNAVAQQNTTSLSGSTSGYKGYYGGHVEYGHRTRNGGFVMAKPYMRPAMEIVAESTSLADAMATAFNGYMSNSLMMSNVLSFSNSGRYGMFSPMNKTYANQASKMGRRIDGSGKRGSSVKLSRGYQNMRSNYTVRRGYNGPVPNSYKGTNRWFNNRGNPANPNSKNRANRK